MSDIQFYKLFRAIAKRKDIKPSDKIVFAIMSDKVGDNGFCWPGIRKIALDSGLSATTVIESIQRLEASELLRVDRRGRGKSNHYYITKSVQETLTLKNPKCSRNLNSGVQETCTQVFKKLEPNQTDTLNQTTKSNSFSFVLRNKNLWQLSQEKLDEYIETFTKLDVKYELGKAAQWLLDNPKRRKTDRGMTRFLSGWLGRAKSNPGQKPIKPVCRDATEREADEILAEMKA